MNMADDLGKKKKAETRRAGYKQRVMDLSWPVSHVDQVFNPFKLVGRNDQCPCESGKKYKRCHG